MTPDASTTPGAIEAPAHDLSLRGYLRQFSNELFHLDARLWRTLRTLLRRPGVLSSAFVAGRGTAFLHPVRIYLIVNVLFFVAVPWVNTARGTIWGVDAVMMRSLAPSYGERLDALAGDRGLESATFDLLFKAKVQASQGAFVALMIPLFAVPLWLLFRRRRRFLVEHLLYATETYTVFLTSLLIFGLVARVLQLLPESVPIDGAVIAAIVAWFLAGSWWFYRSLRTFYAMRWWTALLFFFVSGLFFFAAFYLYAHVLFWTTYLGFVAG